MATKTIGRIALVDIVATGNKNGLNNINVSSYTFLPSRIPDLIAAITAAGKVTFGPTAVRRSHMVAGEYYKHGLAERTVYLAIVGKGACTYCKGAWDYRGVDRKGTIYHTNPESLCFRCTGFDGVLKDDNQ